MGFREVLHAVANNHTPLEGDNTYPSFKDTNESIIGDSTIALLAGTARPVWWEGAPAKKWFGSRFYYFSLTRVYSIFDLVNEMFGNNQNVSLKKQVDSIRKGKDTIHNLCEALRDNVVSFIDTLSYFKTNDDHNYGDNDIVDFRLDFDSFKSLKNTKIIFYNSENTKLALDTIFQNIGTCKLKLVYLPLFKRGYTNKQLANIIYQALSQNC